MTRTPALFGTVRHLGGVGRRLLPLAAYGFAGAALATNGYVPHGYSIVATGMGGANHPASMAWHHGF
jgi:hypothetical protein